MKSLFLRRMRESGIALAIVAGIAAPIHAQTAAANGAAGNAATVRAAVVVFPFENAGTDAQKDWLGEGLSELTTDAMAGHGPLVFSREERLASLEKLGLPAYSRFSRATMIRIAGEIDADYVVFGEFGQDGDTLHVTARVLRVSPPKLSEPFTESGRMDSIAETEARVSWRVLCSIRYSLGADTPCDISSSVAQLAAKPLAHVRADSLEYFARGLLVSDDETRMRDLRESSRLDPTWDEPIFAIGRIFYERRDCESATGWFARVSVTSARTARRPDLIRASANYFAMIRCTRKLRLKDCWLAQAPARFFRACSVILVRRGLGKLVIRKQRRILNAPNKPIPASRTIGSTWGLRNIWFRIGAKRRALFVKWCACNLTPKTLARCWRRRWIAAAIQRKRTLYGRICLAMMRRPRRRIFPTMPRVQSRT